MPNNQHAERHSYIQTYGFGRNTVRIAPLSDGEWMVTIDAVPMCVAKCPVAGLLAAKKYLGVQDDE
jgi:hypothetical protein